VPGYEVGLRVVVLNIL